MVRRPGRPRGLPRLRRSTTADREPASAVDLAEPSDPFAPIDPDGASGLHAFKVASQNEGHTLLTQELCDWLTEQF